jgi:hypothetical protein
VRPAAFQGKEKLPPPKAEEEKGAYPIETEVPNGLKLFRRESEAALKERMRQEKRDRDDFGPLVFPEEQPLPREVYLGRRWPQSRELVEPSYLCHGRLYFEEKNSDRYGWDLGIIQPLVSAASFYGDLLTFPYHWATRPCQRYDCSAGKCLPGDPVPYLCYPPEASLTGLAAEASVVTALFFIFP